MTSESSGAPSPELFETGTYEKMLLAITHPVRRRILRQLADGPASFTEMLSAQEITSSNLAYHLTYLGELVANRDSQYKLSQHGETAVLVMERIEGRTQHAFIPRESSAYEMLVQETVKAKTLVQRVEKEVELYDLGYTVGLFLAALVIGVMTTPMIDILAMQFYIRGWPVMTGLSLIDAYLFNGEFWTGHVWIAFSIHMLVLLVIYARIRGDTDIPQEQLQGATRSTQIYFVLIIVAVLFYPWGLQVDPMFIGNQIGVPFSFFSFVASFMGTLALYTAFRAASLPRVMRFLEKFRQQNLQDYAESAGISLEVVRHIGRTSE